MLRIGILAEEPFRLLTCLEIVREQVIASCKGVLTSEWFLEESSAFVLTV